MKYNSKRYYSPKYLYFNAGKSIMDNSFAYSRHYLNYKRMKVIYDNILLSPADNKIFIEDNNGAFFDTLCRRLLHEQLLNRDAIIILDPHFSSEVICQLIIPSQNLHIINNYAINTVCKDTQLYTNNICVKSRHNTLISYDFFKKYYKTI